MVLSVTPSSADFAVYLRFHRLLRIELWTWLAWLGQLSYDPDLYPVRHLSDVLCACCDFRPLHVGQLGQYDSSDLQRRSAPGPGPSGMSWALPELSSSRSGPSAGCSGHERLVRTTSLPAGVVRTSMISTTSPS